LVGDQAKNQGGRRGAGRSYQMMRLLLRGLDSRLVAGRELTGITVVDLDASIVFAASETVSYLHILRGDHSPTAVWNAVV
jgi:hypothetical protein